MKRRMLDRHYHKIVPRPPPRMRISPMQARPICVDITNAAQWFFEESGQEYWDNREDFPCVAPPWPFSWFEFCGEGMTIDTTGALLWGSTGYLTTSFEIKENARQDALQQDALIQMIHSLQPPGQRGRETGWEIRQEGLEEYKAAKILPRWMCFTKILFEHKKRVRHIGTHAFYICEDGQAMPLVSSSHYWAPPRVSHEQFHQMIIEDKLSLSVMMLPVFFALSLLHCKNVYLKDLPPAPQYSRKARKQKCRGEVTYKTIVIDSMRKQAKQEAQETDTTSVKQALHITRGHFKDYRDGPGLFGKHQDIYWWDMHVRGDADYGEIRKDYKVVGKAEKA